ncbi:hypothetical protein P170DRAFT_359994, partial [Aspergillus steynii IBT 23096]
YTDAQAAEVWRFGITSWDCICNGEKSQKARKAFLDHHSYVRKVVPPERLLELHPQDGWKPLCRFSNPSELRSSYPVTNDTWT